MKTIEQAQFFELNEKVERHHIHKLFSLNSLLTWTELATKESAKKRQSRMVEVGKALSSDRERDSSAPGLKEFLFLCPNINRLNFMQYARVMHQDKSWEYASSDMRLAECFSDYARKCLPEKHKKAFWLTVPFIFYNCSVAGSCQVTYWGDGSVVVFGQ